MRYYLKSLGRQNAVYSVDKLTLGFKVGARDAVPLFALLAGVRKAQSDAPIDFVHWESHKIGTYREQFSIKCENGESYWLGVGLNDGGRPHTNDMRIEFNPNKVATERAFLDVWLRLLTDVRGRIKIVRWDLAVDYPVARETCTLLKDRRLYEEIRHSDADRTQYVGQRNAVGRCKLYNKQAEQNLAVPLTRLELTLDMEHSSEAMAAELMPTVYGAPTVDGLPLSDLSDTDSFILRTLCLAPERVSELSRRKREKLEPLLCAARTKLEFDGDAFNSLLRQMSDFLWGTAPQYDMVDFVPQLGMISPFDNERVEKKCVKTTIEQTKLMN